MQPTSELKLQVLLGVLLFAFFVSCRSTQVLDSNFNLLLSHSLYTHQSSNIRPYLMHPKWGEVVDAQTRASVIRKNNVGTPEETWQLTYPKTPVFLEIPFTYLAEQLGYPVARENPPDWVSDNEHRLQPILASLLMAIYAVWLYRIARLWLPQPTALFMLLPLVVGSSILSTLTRAVWTDTWSTLFIILAMHHLANVQIKKISLNVIYLSTMLALAFFCKPIYALAVVACMLWAWQLDRQKSLWATALGLILAAVFYGWTQYLGAGTLLSNYTFQNFSGFDVDFLLGQLISPSRGLLVFWTWTIPLILAMGFLWKHLHKAEIRLIAIASFPIIALLSLLSFYPLWHGGMAYGPRLSIPALPWLSLVAILLVSAWQRQRLNLPDSAIKKSITHHPLALGFAGVCLTLSLLINLYGAMQPKTFYAWHKNVVRSDDNVHITDKEYAKKFWNWRDPIFLAGIIKPERYFNYAIEITDPSKAAAITEQIQSNTDLLDLVTGKKKLHLPAEAPASSKQ